MDKIYKNLFEQFANAIFIVDPESFSVLLTNEKGASYFDLTSEEVNGKSFLQIIAPHENSDYEDWLANVAQSGQFAKRHCVIHAASDVEIISEIAAKPLNTEYGSKLQIVVSPIDKKEHQKVLKEANDALQKANYLKSTLLSSMSHEIRTPLNSLLGFSSLMRDELYGRKEKELYDYSVIIDDSGNRLLKLINNIIDYTCIQTNTLVIDKNECKLGEVAEYVASTLRPKAQEKGLVLNTAVNDSFRIAIDENRGFQVLNNIIENAIAYSDNGTIDVETGNHKNQHSQEDFVYVRVTDSGPGISSKILPHIFEPLQKDDEGFTRSNDGSGLGLTISKGLVELMGGRFGIKSKEGEGTTITIIFPAVIASGEEKTIVKKTIKPKDMPEPTRDKIRVLIVEDDVFSYKFLTKLISSKAESVVAEDGDKALEIIEENITDGTTFDMVLMDIGLPKPWDGITLREEIIKRWTQFADIPFIAQTAYAVSEDQQKILNSGFTKYISKPINKQELMAMIDEVATSGTLQ